MKQQSVRRTPGALRPLLVSILVLSIGAVVRAGVPVVTSMSPGSAVAGSTVAIRGSGFGHDASSVHVFFGTASAEVACVSDTLIQALVPGGATYGPVSVTVNGLTASSRGSFLLTFSGFGTIGNRSFGPLIDFSSISSGPYRVAIGDIDGDGTDDIVSANYNGSTLAVLRNVTSGDTLQSSSFSAESDQATGLFPTSMVLCDLNCDGKLDVVTAGQYSASLTLFINESEPGVLAFDTPVSIATTTGFKGIVCADFDGDGKPDIAVANREANTLTILQNVSSDASVKFSPVLQLSTPAGPVALAAGDLDGTGTIDLGVVARFAGAAVFYQNTSTPGSISFVQSNVVSLPSSPSSIIFVDLDGDGLLDVATASSGAALVSVLKNQSSGGALSFAARTDWSTIASPSALAAGDLTGDGLPDLAVASSSNAVVAIQTNVSSSSAIVLSAPATFATTSSSMGVAVGDVTGNGIPDIIVADFEAEAVTVLRNAVLPPPRLVVTPQQVVFGPTVRGDTAIAAVVLTDSSLSPLQIDSITTSSSSFSARLSTPRTLDGYSSLSLPVWFMPVYYGDFADTLRVYSDGGTVAVPLSGSSPFPVLVTIPESLDFGSIPQYDTVSASLRLTNTSINPLVIDSTFLAGTSFSAKVAKLTIRSGDTSIVPVLFHPALIGLQYDTLWLANNSQHPRVGVPLRGTGLGVTILNVSRGWNLVSLPRIPSNPDPVAVFAGKASPVYGFNPSVQSYEVPSVLKPGVGYWVYYGSSAVVSIGGTTVDSTGLSTSRAGWVLSGAKASTTPASEPVFLPGSARVSPWYEFDAGTQAYFSSPTLKPGKGYWVYVAVPCTITIK